MPFQRPLLLQGGMEDHSSREQVHARSGIPICPHRRGGTGGGRRPCKNLTIAVDHRPLLKIFGDRSLDISNTRLRNLKEKTLRYRFTMSYIPGVKNRAPDTLSRHPSGTTLPDKMHLQDDISALSVQQHPQVRIPSQLMTGSHSVSSDEDPMETKLQESLISALSATTITTWEEVQTATSSECPHYWTPSRTDGQTPDS